MKNLHFFHAALIFFLSASRFQLHAETIVSEQSGSFADTDTWVGGVVPGPGDSAVIYTGHAVTVSSGVTVGSLNVYCDTDGELTTLDVQSGNTLTINSHFKVESNGANDSEYPEVNVFVRGTITIGGNFYLKTYPAADPALAWVRMHYATGIINLAGNLTNVGEGGFLDARDNVVSNFNLTGISAQTLVVDPEIEYHHVTFNNSSSEGVTIDGNIAASNFYGNITLNSGKFSNNGYSITGTSGKIFTVKNGTTFIMTGTAGLPGGLTHTIESGSTIRFAGTNQTVGRPNNNQSYHHLVLEGSGTKTLGGNIDINGDLTISGCTFDFDDAQDYDITLAGNLSTSSGTILQREGTFTFNGSSQTLSGATTVTGVIYVPTGTTLNTGGNLTLASGASLMHGTGTTGGGGTVSGNVTVQRTGNSGLWNYNFWSSPVASASLPASYCYIFDPSSATANTENGLMAGWVQVSGSMESGRGYAISNLGMFSMTGTANNAPTGTPITLNVEKNAGTSNDVDYNLIGNPFPCALDATAFMNVNGPSGSNVIAGSIYFWDDDNSGGGGFSSADYATWTGAGSINGPNTGRTFSGYIGSGQGFFVVKNSDGTAPVEFRNSMRSTSNSVFFKQQPIQRLWISVTNPDDVYNETLIAFMEEATDTFDALYDAHKLRGNPNLSFYTVTDSSQFAIQAFPLLTDDRTVTIGIDATVTGDYTLRLEDLEDLDESTAIILEDTELGVYQNLRVDPNYSFYLDAGNNIHRFKIHFNPPFEFTAIDETCEGEPGSLEFRQPGNKTWDYEIKDAGDAVIDSGVFWNGNRVLYDLNDGMYTITITDSFGYSLAMQAAIANKEQVVARFQASDSIVAVNTPVYFFDYSIGATGYSWDFGDGNFVENSFYPTHIFTQPGSYNVVYTAYNETCQDVASKLIEVTDVASGIRNINTDEINIHAHGNEVFVSFPNQPLAHAQIEIFNLLGQSIYNNVIPASGVHRIEADESDRYYLVQVTIGEKTIARKVFLHAN